MTRPAVRDVPVQEADGVAYDVISPATTTQGCHYDYNAGTWRQGHDHHHTSSTVRDVVPLYCGADLGTCSPTTRTPPASSSTESTR